MEAAPGIPRPRTRGARRRPPTPSPLTSSDKRSIDAAFPALSVPFSSPRRPLTAQMTSPLKTALSRDFSSGERHSFGSVEDHHLLAQRLHASGLKRCVVQAQLFPDVTGQRPSEGLQPRKRHEAGGYISNQSTEESAIEHKPLVPSLNINPTGAVLIPSRPTSSSATASKAQRQRLLMSAGANTARGASTTERFLVQREPISARDRYYVEQRSTTAPEGMRLNHRLRPPVMTGGYVGTDGNVEEMKRKVEIPEADGRGESNQRHNDIVRDDIPGRGDFLARRNEVKTLTEKLVDGLTQGGDFSGAGGGRASSTPDGAVTRDSFFYLRRVDSNPYNLEMTSHSKINPKDYYTVSRLGITHFAPDGVEFQPLQKFERENYIYSLLVKLPFFKKYRIWKRFTIWKQVVSARKRVHACMSLNNSLFILLPHLHEALLQLRDACLDLQEARLFGFEHPTGSGEPVGWDADYTNVQQQQKTYTLAEFSQRLKAQKTRVERLVDHFISDAEMTAKHACENYLYSFLQNTGFNDVKPGGTNRPRSSVVAAQRKESIIFQGDESQQKPMTYTERATMKTQCRRVTKFLRVVEFLISDAMLRMAISSTVHLRNALATYIRELDGEDNSEDECPRCEEIKRSATFSMIPRSTIQPLLRVEVVLQGATAPLSSKTNASDRHQETRPSTISGGIYFPSSQDIPTKFGEPMEMLEFIPSKEKLRAQLETMVFNGLSAVTNRDRLIRNSMFKAYVEASMEDSIQGGDGDNDGGEVCSEGMDLDILIMEDSIFVETLQSLNTIVLDTYDHAEENCGELAIFLERYQENGNFCKLVSDPSRYLNTDVHDFRGYLDKFLQEAQDVDFAADSAPSGLLLLDRVKLNGYLKPSPRKCLDGLYKLIPTVLHLLNENLTNEYTVANDGISTIPTTVEAFSGSLALWRELQTGQEDMEEKYNGVRSLYHLLEEYRVKMTDTDQMNAFVLTQKRSQLKASIEFFESNCDQYVAKFGVELEARLPSLVSNLTTVTNALSNPILFDLKSDINDTIVYLTQIEDDVLQLEAAVKQHFDYEKTLGLPMTTAFDEMDELKADLALKIDLWKAFRGWSSAVFSWEKLQFPDEIDFGSITEHIERLYAQITKWEQKLSEGMGPLCTNLRSSVEEYRATMPILTDLRCQSFEERHFMQLRELLGFNIRHLNLSPGSPNASVITLGELVKMHLSPFGLQINRIATDATQELQLKDMLTKIVTLWDRLEFDVKPYKRSKDYYILDSLEGVYTMLEESLVNMTAVLNSKFVAPIKDTAVMWHKRLLMFQETFDAWIECQRKWMHLETIFSAPDIQKQLPNEGATFIGVNQFWKDLMRKTRDQRSCLKVTGAILIGASSASKSYKDGGGSSSGGGSGGVGQALLDNLTKHNSSLERIEKSLEDYLEMKRRSFPRFYFISNDELLEMLAHAKEPQIVQRHLPKCFDALAKLDISDDTAHGSTTVSSSQDIVAMISPEGERVAFGRIIKARGNIEDWLNAVLVNMKVTLHKHVKNCLADYQHSSRETWLFRHPAQAVAVVSYIIWAKECELCFHSRSKDPVQELSLWHQTICTQLGNLTRLVRTNLTSVQRRVVVSLVTTDVHFRDIVESLVAKSVTDANDFLWQQQLRYKWYADRDECDIYQANCRIKYGYEYMGASSRLVITPLTDRCWMTITGALELRYGAAPSGPAGTGKTETSKDLAKALGILCIVINCSNQMSYSMMGSIFNGVTQAGAWVCLDEFNRIDIEVLSVVGQQMSVLRNAQLMSLTEVLLDGKCVPLRDHHVIITMNPGYVGRTELPDNLKVSFRPVAMMVPDYALIAEILLFAEGFLLAKPLSRKVTKLYKLCSEQLSQQAHYDFGMRAVRTVLTMAGSLKRSSRIIAASGSSSLNVTATDSAATSLNDENVILIKAMVGANTPKLTDDDNRLFQGIVRDLFPDTLSSLGAVECNALIEGVGVFSPSSGHGGPSWIIVLEEEINEQLRLAGLQGPRQWTKKLLQLFATLEVRVGVIQTGSIGSGKSTALKVLNAAVSALRERIAHPDARFQRVVPFTLNPKSVSMIELYGFFHPITHEWTDGLASKLLRTCVMAKNEEMLARQSANQAIGVGSDPSTWNLPFYWINFDGPIDAHWIESMNTVLDDNMTLCLANGERIKLLPRIQLLFEVADTSAASPATISRLGVVYYHPDCLGWKPFVETWASTLVAPGMDPTPQTSPSLVSTPREPRPPTPLSTKAKTRVLKYFELFVEPGLAFIHSVSSSSNASRQVPFSTCDLGFVATICHIFQALLIHRAPPELFAIARTPRSNLADASSPESLLSLEDQRNRCLDLMFIFSFAWAIGGNLNLDLVKNVFQEFLDKLITSNEQHLSLDVMAIDGKIPTPAGISQTTGDVQDFFIDFQNLSFSPWANACQEQSPQLQQPSEIVAGSLLVPTMDVLKYRYLVELMALNARQPILLTGATGSGKSAIVHNILDHHARIAADIDTSDLDTDSPLSVIAHGKILPHNLNLSAQTSSAGAQLTIESKFSKKRRTLLGAPVNKQLVVIFVDDVNMPTTEKNGAQPVIELLRQYLEYGGLYDRERFFWKDINDSVLIAAGGLPGGGRQTLCPRFVRQFSAVLCLPSCDADAMKAIFNSILASHIAACGGSSVFAKNVKDTLLQTADATCQLYQLVVQGLLPTPSKCHYTFNLRDVTKLMQGIVLGTGVSGTSVASSKKGGAQPTCSLAANTVVNLWAHEGIRVFRDRLMDSTDRRWFSEKLVEVANRVFGVSWTVDAIGIDSATARRRAQSTVDSGNPPKQEHSTLLFSPRRVDKTGNYAANSMKYDQVGDLNRFKMFLNGQIQEYNCSPTVQESRRPPLDLVLFEDAMIHIAAIARILIQPRGHALLLGMGGCGKRSLARLAVFLTGYYCFEIELRKGYGLEEFREDLKPMMKLAVLGDTGEGPSTRQGSSINAVPTVFLLDDSQLTSDFFLEDINTILNGGDIPKLFTTEEMERIISDVRVLLERSISDAKSLNGGQYQGGIKSEFGEFTRKDSEDYFHMMVRNSLHFVICMNPLGEAFRARVRQFPALINCTTIDYFDEWPKSALEYVAEFYLSQEDPQAQPRSGPGMSRRPSTRDFASSSTIRSAVTALCVETHLSVSAALPAFLIKCRRRVYITSQHYLDLISLFRRIHREKKAQWETKLQRLTTGVVKLEETNSLVSTLQEELVVLQPVLVSKTQEAEELLHQVAIDQTEAEQVAQRVRADEAVVKQQQREVSACQVDAQSDLDQALPALNAAVAALDSLDKKDISEVKGFVKPPQAVQVVMEAVCIMLGEKADWDNSKRILSRSTFMAELKEYDKDNIPPAILKKIRKYIESPEFAVEEVKKVSHAAMSLCMWVHAIDTYARVVKEVAPKRQRLAEMNAVLEVANTKLESKQQELAKVLDKVRKLKEECDATLKEKQRLLDESVLTQLRLQNAEKLTEGLSDERVRWKNSITLLKQEGSSILGDSFLVAASLSYLGPFDGVFRCQLLAQWSDTTRSSIGASTSFLLASAYGDTRELREWQLLGLPSNSFSTDNALFALKSKQRWTLMIDPQQQATQWIKRLEVANHLETVKADDPNFMQVVEDCLVGGNPVLIEDVTEALNPSLEPVVAIKPSQRPADSKRTIRKLFVKLDDRLVETDAERFRLYLTTKLANPHFVPDVYIRVNVINFTVTSDGLEEQLLSDVVQRERMEVEERKHTLLASIARDQKQLQDLEIRILYLLTDAKGNILDDVELIRTLETSKQTSNVVAQRLSESEATKQEVLEIRDQYQGVAVRGAMLFFVIADLADIDPMYQFSLEYFNRLFIKSLNEAPVKRNLSERLVGLQHHITLAVYRNICRGLFKAHKQLFALVVCLKIVISAGELNQCDVVLLDRLVVDIDMPTSTEAESTNLNDSSSLNPPNDDVIGDLKHSADAVNRVFLALSRRQPVFTELLTSYYRDNSAWTTWIASDNPFLARLPEAWDETLPRFMRLVIVRWLREDTFMMAIRCFIEQTLGAEFLDDACADVEMKDVYSDLDESTPCLFILSPGADPISTLEHYAREKGIDEDKYHVISLGQGQGPIVEAKLVECKTQGYWLILQNVHLAKSWLPELQTLLTNIKQEARSGEIHEDFRLFLASFPVAYFPISVLQNSVKVMTESPMGVKANLQRSMMLLKQMNADGNDAHLATLSSNVSMKLRLAFGLSFFHAIVRERSKFGSLGWNLKYDFSDADFVSAVTLQRRLLDAAANMMAAKGNTNDFPKAEAGDDSTSNAQESSTGSTFLELHAVPWDALLFLAGDIYYGGRVTDEFDRRCLMAVLRRFCSEPCFKRKSCKTHRSKSTIRRVAKVLTKARSASFLEDTIFSSDDGSFFAPEFQSEGDMVRFVDGLQDMDGPHVFGIHPNAHVSYQRQQTNRFVKLVMQLQPSTSEEDLSLMDSSSTDSTSGGANGKGVKSMEQTVVSVSKAIHEQLPPPATLETIEARLLGRTRENWQDPLNVVLQQEVAACHKSVRHVDASLVELQHAIQGIAVMSATIEQSLHSIAAQQVPVDWNMNDTNSTPTTESLSQWVKSLLDRYEFLHRWVERGRVPGNVFPLPFLSFPQGFFTAILQRYSRKHGIPIHFLDFKFRVLSEAESVFITSIDVAAAQQNIEGEVAGQVDDGAYLTGLVLEGAHWNNELGCLCSSQPGIMRQNMPIIQVLAQRNSTLAVASSTVPPKAPDNVVNTSTRNMVIGDTKAAARAKQPLKRGDTYRRSSRSLMGSDAEATEDSLSLNMYSCPVYRTAMRKGTLSTTGTSTNLVLAMDLPCQGEPDYFVLNGTALVCSNTFE
ncbi:Dynein heavy chain 6, axonemal [Phytophthora idaei]|nr:Dynein heavy chain 6, axonemal [Phytophthora idaei]KAG3151303.1 Dynein heavy chain 6, axonemal [Phytophthora idaei]